MHALLDDPWVKARIDAAIAPYHNLVSPDDLAFMRDELAEMLVRDERAARMLRRARPREDVDASGEAFVGRFEHASREKPGPGAQGVEGDPQPQMFKQRRAVGE